ncbi:helix-turn-helix domain-containing protein [Paenibacillus naphthalenovorans]|uniref:helix-turn-helix domain-containing protein n=1 Tax=Paenibacillus naphthalenovorans TaxID=162209 RepID=UPI00088CBF4B|nr:helix-turn-helix transcriptional regulator [Paenibacillus naphthalenovorans]SDJ59210.1 Helix-turn-helix [Paenibacillus naphthalenovorans]
MSIGNRIKALRMKKGLTQDQMAEKLGMNRANFSNYERGVASPPGETISKIAAILNTTTDYLLGRTEDPSPLELIPTDPSPPEVRAIQRAAKNMSPNDRRKMLNMIRAAFEEAFSEDD